MSSSIEIQNDQAFPADLSRLESVVATALQRHPAHVGSSVTVVLTDDAQVAGLNAQFRDVAAPTDVLSFPADPLPVTLPDEPPYLGDIVIAYPYAAAQAGKLGYSLDDNLALLVLHGTLHLLGYDHDTPEHKALMWQMQASIAAALDIPPALIPALEEDDDHGEQA